MVLEPTFSCLLSKECLTLNVHVSYSEKHAGIFVSEQDHHGHVLVTVPHWCKRRLHRVVLFLCPHPDRAHLDALLICSWDKRLAACVNLQWVICVSSINDMKANVQWGLAMPHHDSSVLYVEIQSTKATASRDGSISAVKKHSLVLL